MRLRKSSLVAGLATAAIALLSGGQAVANASVLPLGTESTTYVLNDPDSGGNGNWAIDNFKLQVFLRPPTSCGPSCYHYTGKLSTQGTSTTIKNAFRPNQGNPQSGLHIIGAPFKVAMTGTADYDFTANHLANASLAPAVLNLHGSGGVGTPNFYQHLFPVGTTFTDNGVAFGNSWSFVYRDVNCHQIWTDAWNTDDGQAYFAGNINGGPACLPVPATLAAKVTPNLKNVGGFTPSTAVTNVTKFNVGGGNGVWASSGFKQTATITGGADVPVADCAPQAVDCYIYQMDIKDTGTFKSILSAFRPNQFLAAGKRIAGVVAGKVTGVLTVQFYSSGVPHEEIVPGGKSGGFDAVTWYKSFFGAGTRFGTAGLKPATWTFSYAGCGQTWTNSTSNSKGQSATAGNIRSSKTC